MAFQTPPTRRVSSPRYLSIRHAKRLLKAQEASPIETNDIPAGKQKLFSKYIPGLQGGDYVLNVQQTIEHTEQSDNIEKKLKKTPHSEQKFHVHTPRFSLPKDEIYSTYPPSREEATNDVLAHVVFKHPTTPWDNRASSKTLDMKLQSGEGDLNSVPWLALLTFTAEELVHTPTEVQSFFTNTAAGKSVYRQNETLGVEIKLSDLLQLDGNVVTAPAYDEKLDFQDATSPNVNLIFTKSKLFNDLFSDYSDDGAQAATGPNIVRHRFLSHARSLYTEGMAIAGKTDDEPRGNFGIVIANRCAPTNFQRPTNMFVHLVSLEKLEDIKPFPIPTANSAGTPRHAALVSLHSWIYTCLPPNTVDIRKKMINLGQSVSWLQPNFQPKPEQSDTPAKKRALQRLAEGYSMVRYRVQTGEETVAFTRGPLIPNIVDARSDIPSDSGYNLQIMDKELGVMDISYSAAWQLGRTMAMADRAYTAALTRLRRLIQLKASNRARERVLLAHGRPHLSRMDVVRALPDVLDSLKKLSWCDESVMTDQTWERPDSPLVDLSLDSLEMSNFLDEEIMRAARLVGSTTDITEKSADSPRPYTEVNTPYSIDWMTMYKFLFDLYHLVHVPAHYLITDPSHLPEESIKFFIIDKNWTAALIDGALSLGNHTSFKNDPIKAAIKKHLKSTLGEKQLILNYTPPIPRCGFFIRSEVIAKFPDLQVEIQVDNKTSADTQPILLRHEIMSKDVMVGFLTERPLTDGPSRLVLTTPSHQQYFSVGHDFTSDHLGMEYKPISSTKGINRSAAAVISRPIWPRSQRGTDNRPVVYVWGSSPGVDDIRLLLVDKLAQNVHETLRSEWGKHNLPNEWVEPFASAAMTGLQLNTYSLQLVIDIPKLQVPPQQLFSDALSGWELVDAPKSVNIKKYPPKVPGAGVPSLKVRENLRPVQQAGIPPHRTRIITAELLDRFDPCDRSRTSSWSSVSCSASISSFVMTEPAKSIPIHIEATPKFRYSVWSITNPKDKNVVIQEARQDIVFSIVRAHRDDAADFLLESLTLSFNYDSDDVPRLMDNYEGVYASMVSNLRFNVRVVESKSTQELQLRLLPRSRNGYVPVRQIRELSVLLSRVRVKQYTSAKDVMVTAKTSYVDSGSTDVTFPIPLRLKGTT